MSCWYYKWTDLCYPAPHSLSDVSPPSPAVLLSPLKSGNSAFGWSGKLSTAWWDRRGWGVSTEWGHCTAYSWQSPQSWHWVYLKFSRCRLTIRKQHFLNSPKTPTPEESLPSPPLPSLYTPHQAGFELSVHFVIMSTKSTPTFSNYRHSQVTIPSYVKGTFLLHNKGLYKFTLFLSGTMM